MKKIKDPIYLGQQEEQEKKSFPWGLLLLSLFIGYGLGIFHTLRNVEHHDID